MRFGRGCVMKDLKDNEIILGPTPEVELDLLSAIIAQVKPTTILEFGHQTGSSAKAILKVIDESQHLYSFDNSCDTSIVDSRFSFFKLAQQDYNHELVNKLIDFVYIDASHDLDLNKETFKKIYPHLSSEAIIVVHDTGYWNTELYKDIPFKLDKGIVAHRPDEIAFTEWLWSEYGLYKILFSTTKEFRCGLTVLQ